MYLNNGRRVNNCLRRVEFTMEFIKCLSIMIQA